MEFINSGKFSLDDLIKLIRPGFYFGTYDGKDVYYYKHEKHLKPQKEHLIKILNCVLNKRAESLIQNSSDGYTKEKRQKLISPSDRLSAIYKADK